MRIEGKIHNNELEFSVIDYGWGIADIEEARRPLFTGKPELERSGMGFSIMESFMDSIEVISSPGEGTTVKMTKIIEKYEYYGGLCKQKCRAFGAVQKWR